MNKIITIPEFKDEEKQRRANILVTTQFASIIMIVAIMVISFFLTPEHSEVLLQGGAGAVAMLFSYLLLKKGKLEAAGWVIVILGWLILTLDLALFSGIRGVNILGQVLLVMFAGLAINGRSAIIITGTTVLVNLIILQLEQNGILAQPLPLEANFSRWFIQTVYLMLAAVYIWRSDTVIKRALFESQSTADRYRALFERTNDGVVILNLDWFVLSSNSKAADLMNLSMAELIGEQFITWDILVEPEKIKEYKDDVLRGDDIPNFEHVLRRKDGSTLPVEISMALVPDAEGNPLHIQCIMRDITERKDYEHQLKHQALHDPLTNLPNRTLFENRFELVQSRRSEENSLVAVLFIDMDGFKLVNDTYGHSVGDQVLMELGARLQGVVRESDTVARVGGDEFLIILDNIYNKSNVSRIAEKLVEGITHPFQVGEHLIQITASIGINFTDKNNLSEVDLIKTSDTAMYQVKEDGKNDFRFYDSVDLS
ncbi:MAG: sensor domain-containing diguanylate cyclase [Anaerolineales bacterium]|nr:sensor domain-containing diguanylate cyclase [Anaerolineales bacterium]